MKIITADHSGEMLVFNAIADRSNAEQFARDLKVSLEQWWDDPPPCSDGESYDDFLAGGNSMDCEMEGESSNKFLIRPFRELFEVHADFDKMDVSMPNTYNPPIVREPILEISHARGADMVVRMRGRSMTVGELYDEALRS